MATEANAQADTGSAAPAPAASGGLEEIVVTATRHEESLSKVPLSVTALTQESMDQLGIKDFQDVARFTPGVNIDTSGTNAISIRGISSSGGAGTTGIYLDDTPIQMRSVGFNPDDTLPKTFDLQRVEILRGPQGTLFGAGSEGGAVRYILTQPSTTETDTYVRSEVAYTQYGQPSGEVGIAHGQPIVDGTFGVRGSLWYRYDGGWINRVDDTTGEILDHNVELLQFDGRPSGGGLEAHVQLHRDPERSVPAPGQERRFDLLAGLFRCVRRAFQYGDAGARRRPGHVLPAGAEVGVGSGQQPAHFRHLVLSPQADHRLPGYGLRSRLLAEHSAGRTASRRDPGTR